MSDTSPEERERALYHGLLGLVHERSRAETAHEAKFAQLWADAETTSREWRTRIDSEHANALAVADAAIAEARRALAERRDEERAASTKAAETASRRAKVIAKQKLEEAEETLRSARWEATTIFDAAQHGAVDALKIAKGRLSHEQQAHEDLVSGAEVFLRRSRMSGLLGLSPANPPEPPATSDPIAAFAESNVRADAALHALERHPLARLFQGGNLFGLFLFVAVIVAVPSMLLLDPITGAIVAGVSTLVVCMTSGVGLYIAARRVVSTRHPAVMGELDRGAALSKRALEWIIAEDQRRREEASRRKDADIRKAERVASKAREEIESARVQAIRAANSSLSSALAGVESRYAADLAQAEAESEARYAEIERSHLAEIARWQDHETIWRPQLRRETGNSWADLAGRWRRGMADAQREWEAIRTVASRAFPDHATPPSSWVTPASPPSGMRFGEFDADLAAMPGGLPTDAALRGAGPAVMTLPALIPFPGNGSLMVRANRSGKGPAVDLIQAVMYRYLTSIPPGKVRFTIFDPVGLGQNFAAFMHLADYDEQLITGRIWTEPQQIEQRLADLTEHMEKVIQKYLRNEFSSIQEYNIHAGEVAEPYRVLVLANFPANISEMAAKRLASIAQSGPRCGVYVLMTVDEQLPLPAGCTLADYEKHATRLAWREGRFVWLDPDFGSLPLRLDAPPDPETATRILHHVGDKARAAGRVEVPFEIIAPSESQIWSFDSRSLVDVPLGRVGANKLQSLILGKGTSQHALIAGRTGSGKSTLLHALITNVALRYSPDEVELYLIDFKKGVEFKTYAAFRLPHARVVAIESEREFGLSVLQRLDDELRRRGELFRAHNVQDVAGYRDANPGVAMPRILLIVDEFQEFFVEDDKVAQDCALLLDRLVRQGRAFGIHAQLGSQTLGGAFSLARSTLGQMAVRIALQCSESDAHLILSEENSAARLLSRPGEAIYNDANGMVEGNHFFQVVWLSDERKEAYLKQIFERDLARNPGVVRPQIVFEGNVAADLSRNVALRSLLEAAEPPKVKAPVAWLGDAVAIKDPTSAIFRRQSGSHMLLVGQNEEAARGVMTGAILGLASQFPAAGAGFHVLDGTADDSIDAGYYTRIAGCLAQEARVGDARETANMIGELHSAVERRLAGEPGSEGPLFLFVHDMARFRDLRKSDDDFSFSRKDEKPSPSKQLATILRDGPGVDVHAIIWCDSLNNLNRTFDRQTLREFELRVLFQMSPNDSSTLIDSPLASRLGPHRAFFSSEEQGKLEKFRPYGQPSDDWLSWAKSRWDARRALDAVAP